MEGQRMAAAQRNLELWANRFAQLITRHWLMMINACIVLYATLPWISPMLKQLGWHRLGGFLSELYSLVCHQRPERSFFVGQNQVCFCHRCTALYGACAVIVILFGAFRWRWTLPTSWLLIAGVPILIDGLWHTAADLLPGWGLRSSLDAVGSLNFWLRIATGILFGVALILWTLPRLDAELRKAQ
jgi:uncharacterized membrane protein